MQRLFLFLALTVCLAGCSSDDAPGSAETWALSSVEYYQTGLLQEREDLPWNETLYFYPRGIFKKVRLAEGEREETNGRYTRTEIDGIPAYRVVYPSSENFVFDCFGTANVERFLREEDLLIQREGVPCDGPEYRYERQ